MVSLFWEQRDNLKEKWVIAAKKADFNGIGKRFGIDPVVARIMRNRGLTTPTQLAGHPAASCEYVLVPLLLRCLQIADQLSVSAVARGAERPGKRGSYYGKRSDALDGICLALWTGATAVFLFAGGVRI